MVLLLLCVGIFGTILGVLGGIAVAQLIVIGFNAIGAGFPTPGVVLLPRTIIISAMVGIGVTMLSVIIPVLDEAENLPRLYRELVDVAAAEHYELQMIIVDDGSNDGSGDALRSIESASDDAAYVTGQAMLVDGGWSLGTTLATGGLALGAE